MKNRIKNILLILTVFLTFIVALTIGRKQVTIDEIFLCFKSLIFSDCLVDKVTYNTIINIRLPRILLSLTAGASLAVSGYIYQKLFSNPLATPDTLGVSSGASFGAALAILFKFNYFGIEVISFIFGIVAVIMTYCIGIGRNFRLKFVILAGVMISSFFTSLVSFIKYVADVEQVLPNITFWLMGSLSSITYKKLIFGIVPMIICLILAVLYRYKLSLLAMSNEELVTLGVNAKAIRIFAIVISTIMTSAAVSLCGLVSFVGLVIPHLVSMIFNESYKTSIPYVICVGAIYLTIIDLIARSATEGEIPISILTSLIGVPFFIFIMRKSVQRQL